MKKTLFLSAILGAILAVPTMAEVTYGGTIYTYTPKDGSSALLHEATFTETTIVDGEFVVGTNTVGYIAASANNDSDNTLRYVAGGTATTSKVKFNDLTIGGVIVDANSTITTLENDGNRTFYIGVDNKTSGSSINKSFTIKTTAGSINLRGTQEIAIAAEQTLTLSASSSIELKDNANVTVSGTGALAVNKAFTLGTGSTLALSGGMTLKLDNMPTGADRYDTITTSGITNRYAQCTLATGTGSVTRTGTQNATLNGVAKTITWADDNKSFEFLNGQVYQVIAGETKAVSDVNTAIAAAGVNTIVADGTLTGINATVSTASTTATIIGSGTVQVNGEFQYYNKSFLENFTGTVEILSGETHIGDQGGKFSRVSAITLTGGALKGWSTTFGKNITLNGGSLSAAGNTMTYSGRVTINASSTIEGNGGQGTKLTGFVDAKAGDITIKGTVTSSAGFDMSGNSNRYTSNMLIKAGATFTSTGTLWVSDNSYNHTTFTLEQGGKFVKGDYTITGLEGSGTFVSGSTAALDMNGGHTLTNVAVVYNGNEATNNNKLAGTTTLKNTGTNLLTFNGTIAAGATLEGVMDEDGVSNVKYTKNPNGTFGTIKNVNILNFDAGARNSSITMDGVFGTVKDGADIWNVKLIGNGLTLTNANKFTTTLSGTANLIGSSTAMAADAAITINGSTWTGTFKGRANAAITMNENSAASFEGGEGNTLTLTLKGTSYTGDHISDASVIVTNDSTDPGVTIANTLTNVSLTAAGTLKLSGDTNTLTGVATVGGFSVGGETTLSTTEVSDNTAGTYLALGAGATLNIDGKANLTVNGTEAAQGVWMGAGSEISIGASASLTTMGMTVKNGTITNTNTAEEQIGTHSSMTEGRHFITISGDTTVNAGTTNVGDYTFSGGTVKVNSGTTTNILATLSANDTKTDLLVTGSNKEEAIFTEAEFGDKDVTLGKLTLDADTTVTLGNHKHTLALESLTVNGSGSVINANLAISGGTMTMSSSVEMGCSITLGANGKEALTLTNATVNGEEQLENYILFTGVNSLTLGNTTITEMGWYDASTVFSTLSVNGGEPVTIDADQYVIGYWDGTVSIADKSVPEPATATLSLLALAALAARRKRK